MTVAPMLVRAPAVVKRGITLTSSASFDCNSYVAPECTTTIEGVTTEILPYTETVQGTAYDSALYYSTMYSTSYDVATYTYTPDAVTVAGDETQSALPEEQDSTSQSSGDPTSSNAHSDPSQDSNPGPTDGSSPGSHPNPSNGPPTSFSTVVVPTTPPSNSRDSSALAVLQDAVPATAQSDAAGACFLFTQYTSAYTTPAWYTGLETDVQSYFSSANAQNTAACSPSPMSNQSVGLSSGAKGGIAGGAIAAAALLGGLAYLAFTKFIAPKPMAKSAPTQAQPDNTGQSWQDNSGQPWQQQDNTEQPWQDNTGQPNTLNQPTAGPNSGGPEMSQPGGWSGVTGDPSSGGWSGVTGDPSSGGWNGVMGSSPPGSVAPPPGGHGDELFIIAGAGRRRRSQEAQRPLPPGHAYSNQNYSNPAYSNQSYSNQPSPGMYTPPIPSPYGMPRRDGASRVHSGLSGTAIDPFADHSSRRVSAASPGSELSTSGALRGQEAGGSQRYEAPSVGGAYFASSEVDGRQRYEAPTSRHY